MKNIFFDSWESLIRTLVISVLAYVVMIVFLRLSGKRTLSKMNAFDFIITIALGSTLATVILIKNVALADGALAFFLLIIFQYIITYFSAHNKGFSHLVKSTPSLLVYNGVKLNEMMKKERIAEDEIQSILREKGFGSIEQVNAIVLETDGSLTVIKNVPDLNDKTFEHLKKPGNLQEQVLMHVSRKFY